MRYFIFIGLILALLSYDYLNRDKIPVPIQKDSTRTEKGGINSIVIPDTTYEYQEIIHVDPLTGQKLRFK